MLTLHQFTSGSTMAFRLGWTVSSLPSVWFTVMVHQDGAVTETTQDVWSLRQRPETLLDNNAVEHYSLDGVVYPRSSGIRVTPVTVTDGDGNTEVIDVLSSGKNSFLRSCSASGSTSYSYPGTWVSRNGKAFSRDISLSYEGSSNTRGTLTLSWEHSSDGKVWHRNVKSDKFTFDWTRGLAKPDGGSNYKATYFGGTGSIDPIPRKWELLLQGLTSVGQPALAAQEVARRCAQDAQYIHSNLYEFFKDLPTFGISEMRALERIGRKPNLQNLASGHLGFHYGSRLTIGDTSQILGDLFAPKRATSRAAFTEVIPVSSVYDTAQIRISHHGKVYYSSRDETPMLDELQRWGVLPSITDLWEVIPLSFAVDWFVAISDRISVFDAKHHYSRFPTAGFILSRKVDQQIPGSLITPNWVGSVRARAYIRSVHAEVPQPSYYNSNPTQFNNLVELGALLIVKR